MKDLKNIKTLLIILVVITLFYVLKVLSFIFIPLAFALFFALLFLPLMRWFNEKKVPLAIGLFIIVLIIAGTLTLAIKLSQLAIREILAANTGLFENIQDRLKLLLLYIEDFLRLKEIGKEGMMASSIGKIDFPKTFFGFLKSFLNSTWKMVSMMLTTLFFLLLLLAGSLNVQDIMRKTMYKHTFSSIKIFREIEIKLITFIKVKFMVSMMAGIGVSLTCLFFHIDFPVFWGLLTFALHFVQMIGAMAVIVLLSLFALIEIQFPGVLFLFILIITGLQLLFGSILEPILMGRSFSINTITILVMLMFWGFLWGVPGLILSVPISVFLKSIFEQFPNTQIIAEIMSGSVKPKFVNKVRDKILKKDSQ